MKNYWNSLGLIILPLIITIYIKTLRIKVSNSPGNNTNYVFVFWHSKMLVGWWLFRNRNSAALVSQSKDGDILNKILARWNYKVVRGSSSKGGKQALNELTELVRNNNSAVITPDGPRGPAGKMKNGAIIISKECDVPIIPVKITYKNSKKLDRSWDKFEIPYPFSECEVNFGNKFEYGNNIDETGLNQLKEKISVEM